jgi:hypothetical protein
MVPSHDTTFSRTVAWAREGVEQIGINNLYALKLGNEPTFYPWFSINEYAKRFKNLQARLIDAIPSLADKRIFQASTPHRTQPINLRPSQLWRTA